MTDSVGSDHTGVGQQETEARLTETRLAVHAHTQQRGTTTALSKRAVADASGRYTVDKPVFHEREWLRIKYSDTTEELAILIALQIADVTPVLCSRRAIRSTNSDTVGSRPVGTRDTLIRQ